MTRITLPPEAMGDELTKEKKRHRHLERSRLGCKTCRIRKIKCDQKLPFCERCTTTGRQCEGRAAPSFEFVLEEGTTLARRLRKPPSTISTLQPSTSLCDPREQHAFYHFLNEAAPVMSGIFDTGFWTRLVPQVSHIEPAVQKTLFAIGQLFDTPLHPGGLKNKIALKTVPTTQRMVYTWYSYAVTELQSAVSNGSHSLPMALLSFVLIVCVEYQLDNASGALLLLQNGVKLLESALDAVKHGPFDPVSSAILEIIVPFFSRHLMIGATFGFPPPPEWRIDAMNNRDIHGIHSSTETLDRARVSLYSLMYEGNAFVVLTWLQDQHYPLPPSYILAGQQQLVARVEAWREDYLALLCDGAREPTGMSDDSKLTHCLLMYHDVLRIWLATCISAFQMAFDDHFAGFENILSHAETILNASPQDAEHKPLFATDMGVVPPLFFVVIKCRHPLLRRRALALLESMPQLEGVYRILPTIDVLRKFIEVEEEGIGSTLSTKEKQSALPKPAEEVIGSPPSTELILPEEVNRIHHVEVLLNSTTKSITNASIRMLRVSYNANGQRHMREDIFALNSVPNTTQTRPSATRALPTCPPTKNLLSQLSVNVIARSRDMYKYL